MTNLEIYIFRVLAPYLSSLYLHDFSRNLIDDVLDQIEDERELSNARINRYAAIIRPLLNLSRDEWEWIDKAKKDIAIPLKQDALRILDGMT